MRRPALYPFEILLMVLFVPWSGPTLALADAGDPPGRVARLSLMQGKVSLQPPGEDQWSDASKNYPVTTGDRLYTDQGARAELEVGPYAARMSETTDLTLVNLTDQLWQLGLSQGSLRLSVYRLPDGQTVEVDTPNGALTVERPGRYRVDVDPDKNLTFVTVNTGSLEVTGGAAPSSIEANQAYQLSGSADDLLFTRLEVPPEDDFDEWCASRDRRLASFASRQYVSPEIPGCEDLDEYGRWGSSAYGPVWYPEGVAVGWVPYRSGQWVWVSPWGWTWVEDEPWGFVPFHYGRWVFLGSAWAWIPGPVEVVPVYAPALVAFVGGQGFSISLGIGGQGVQAWFPLGPGEPFIPWYHYGNTYFRQVNVTNVRSVTNITNITNITNVENITYVNRAVATTAVPSEVFRSGQAIAGRALRVTPQEAVQAHVVAHPSVAPAAEAVFAGRPLAAPPARPAGVARAPRGGRAPEAVPAGRPSPPPQPAGTRPFERGQATAPPSRPAPTEVGRTAPPVRSIPSAQPSVPPARWVTKSPAPEQAVPFDSRQQALQAHPGRPLEPQQVENLRQGKPAGPMLDREVPSHEHPAPQGKSAPPGKPEPRSGKGESRKPPGPRN